MLKLLPLVLAACVTVSPSGRIGATTPAVADFHGVDVSSGMVATVAIGPTAVRIEADEAVLPYVHTRVVNGELKVWVERSGVHFRSMGPIVATLVTPQLDGIEASGASEVTAAMTPSKSCALETSGASKVKVTGLACEALAVESSGASHINAVGTAEKIEITASGASTVGVRQVTATTVSVEGSGGAEVRAFASTTLNAELSGGTSLYVSGKPGQRSVEASGGASIVDAE